MKKELQSSYDSIAQAARALDTSIEVLRKAKKEGAPGFRGSRVYPGELVPWLHGKEELSLGLSVSEKEKLELRKLLRQCELLEVEIRFKEQKAWDSNDVRTAWLQHMLTARQEWLKIRSGLAPRLAGRSALECEKILEAGIALGLERLRKNPYGATGKVFCPCCKADITPKLLGPAVQANAPAARKEKKS